MTQKSNDSGQVVRSRKRGMEKNETGASKSDKVRTGQGERSV